jgi:ferritin-like metal-binding protein YciE
MRMMSGSGCAANAAPGVGSVMHRAIRRSDACVFVTAIDAHRRRSQSEDQALGADTHPRGDQQTTSQRGEHDVECYRIRPEFGLPISPAARELPFESRTDLRHRIAPKERQMAAQTLHELFVEELRDMYDAEKRLIKALPKIARHVQSDELRSALTEHLRQTEKQVTRLEQVFRSIDETPKGKKCDGMMGILEEGNTAMEELEEGPVLDAALIAGCQKVEHYEIASYGTLAYFAELMGHERAKELLGTTLDEEKAADEKLNAIAKSDVNRDALTGEGSEDEDMESAGSRPMRRGASMGMVNERPSRRRSGTSRKTGSSRGRSSSRRSR